MTPIQTNLLTDVRAKKPDLLSNPIGCTKTRFLAAASQVALLFIGLAMALLSLQRSVPLEALAQSPEPIRVRATDIVGRWSRDSFAVVAPFAGPAEAEIIAVRIHRAVNEARFEGDVLQPAACCSVTVSHASTPREATGPDALVDLVEQRLSTVSVEPPAGVDGAPSPEASATAGA